MWQQRMITDNVVRDRGYTHRKAETKIFNKVYYTRVVDPEFESGSRGKK
jgi:hypothetical protein